jgi:dolichol kinase
MTSLSERWNRSVDLVVRTPTGELGDRTAIARKLLHTSQIVAVLPFITLSRRTLALALLGSCAFVLTTQRRTPWASLGLLTLLLSVRRTAFGGAWVVFTAGDGLAGVAGRLLSGPHLPWNRAKTWAGSTAFLLAATAALYAFLERRQPRAGRPRSFLVALFTSLAAATVETLPLPLDDNYAVPVVAGLLLELSLRCGWSA